MEDKILPPGKGECIALNKTAGKVSDHGFKNFHFSRVRFVHAILIPDHAWGKNVRERSSHKFAGNSLLSVFISRKSIERPVKKVLVVISQDECNILPMIIFNHPIENFPILDTAVKHVAGKDISGIRIGFRLTIRRNIRKSIHQRCETAVHIAKNYNAVVFTVVCRKIVLNFR